jgi:hypothetical protein
VKLFKKTNSRFYWYDFTVRGCRYRGSTQETKSVRALQVASLKLASAMENTDPLPSKPPVLGKNVLIVSGPALRARAHLETMLAR